MDHQAGVRCCGNGRLLVYIYIFYHLHEAGEKESTAPHGTSIYRGHREDLFLPAIASGLATSMQLRDNVKSHWQR